MFESLSDKLQRVFKDLRGQGKLSPENMETALKEIRVALFDLWEWYFGKDAAFNITREVRFAGG